jgi:hypothetical protein
MKWNVALGSLVILLAYATCQNLKKSGLTSKTDLTVPIEDGSFGYKASKVFQADNPNTAYTHQSVSAPRRVLVPWEQIAKPTTSRRAYMATGWWSPIMAYQPSDTTVHKNFIGKWFRFAEDQTFTVYVDGKVTDKGNWSYDDLNKVIYVACEDPWFNNSWLVQERGFRMVWKGNTDLNVTGIQVRMDNHPSPPWVK